MKTLRALLFHPGIDLGLGCLFAGLLLWDAGWQTALIFVVAAACFLAIGARDVRRWRHNRRASALYLQARDGLGRVYINRRTGAAGVFFAAGLAEDERGYRRVSIVLAVRGGLLCTGYECIRLALPCERAQYLLSLKSA